MFIRQETKVADAYICRGLSYLHLKDTTRAYDNFNLAIRTNREDPNGYNRRGGLHLEQEQYEEAEADFNKAIRCDSNYLLSYFNRALVYNATNRPMQALADFDKVIRLDSTNSLTYFNRAMLRTQIGDYNRALEDYDRVAPTRPTTCWFTTTGRGFTPNWARLEKAVADYTSAIDLYPDFANAYIYRGRLREVLRDPKGAKRDLETAQRKIAEYRSRLSDSTYSIYADTTQRLTACCRSTASSREAASTASRATTADARRCACCRCSSSRSCGPTRRPRRTPTACSASRISSPASATACSRSRAAKATSPPDSLLAIDRRAPRSLKAGDASWITQFERGVSQALIKQYTNSVNTYTAAIDRNPSNPFLYFNRSTTRAEMIDFISSIDNSYQRITIDSDPANRLNNNSKRTYSYDEAVADLNKALSLFPDFAHAYYNRANLQALSDGFPKRSRTTRRPSG